MEVGQVGQLERELREPVGRQLALSERSKTGKTFREKIEEIIGSRKHLKSFNISNMWRKRRKPVLVEEEGLEVAEQLDVGRKEGNSIGGEVEQTERIGQNPHLARDILHAPVC